ncbi:hypothetical protein [Asaia sp. HumB]|uniref:hypothetical protein n=1 Tax=Asaia sp. HumB TaxID=3035475 RepID=UPI00255513B6|nr:hypothetical protein [Asaia sp. HumB]MDL2169587.1 hypothetical protein [Asaia sp. HumB]
MAEMKGTLGAVASSTARLEARLPSVWQTVTVFLSVVAGCVTLFSAAIAALVKLGLLGH